MVDPNGGRGSTTTMSIYSASSLLNLVQSHRVCVYVLECLGTNPGPISVSPLAGKSFREIRWDLVAVLKTLLDV